MARACLGPGKPSHSIRTNILKGGKRPPGPPRLQPLLRKRPVFGPFFGLPGRFPLLRPANGLTTDFFVVKYTGRGLAVKRPGVLSKVQMLNLVLAVGVFSLLPNKYQESPRQTKPKIGRLRLWKPFLGILGNHPDPPVHAFFQAWVSAKKRSFSAFFPFFFCAFLALKGLPSPVLEFFTHAFFVKTALFSPPMGIVTTKKHG